jgi:hypothetical protein
MSNRAELDRRRVGDGILVATPALLATTAELLVSLVSHVVVFVFCVDILIAGQAS